ncbi:Gfo/Idh/MocA family protein [Paenibacillus beijingensis]|uniref:Dehydrogenase n=1 Tax=Paenibacillus beijingensis TaxID=1126833 RepID=A0A0D5NR03_9BACL|nr:Gfo/Idh/MocA family oxidoreductase [Paenibacillus beijingensis]AJY77744.1 dehydrogenase [Paenibacillus beijingensis]
MKIGVISLAHMHAVGYMSAINQLEGVELTGIWHDDAEAGGRIAERFGTTFYADFNELIGSGIDAVIVTSENVNHVRHVVAAAEAGKHVLCEKPLATKIEDAQAMIDICRANGVLLQTAFPVRFQTSVKRGKQLLESGKYGNIIAIKGTNRGRIPGGWFLDRNLSGGGAVIDHTVHVVDVMRWYMGAEVTKVYAESASRFSNGLIDDCGMLTMSFDNGVFASLDCSWSRNKKFPTWGDVTLEIVCENGTLSIDAFNQKLNRYSDETGLEWDFWGDDMDLELIRDFVRSIREGKREASVTGEDGLRAVEVALAAYESSESHAVVTLR